METKDNHWVDYNSWKMEKEFMYKYSVEDIQKLLDEMLEQDKLPQFYKISDNLYQYKYGKTSYIGTLEFFELADKEVRENIKKYGRLQ